MIKFMMTQDGTNRKVLGMIIEQGNIDNLVKGLPIHFHAEQMDLDEIKCNEILIAFYKTQEEAIEFLKHQGFLDDAVIRREPRKQ